MGGMARSCGADIPEAEEDPETHSGILQNDGESVKLRGAFGVNSRTGEMGGTSNSCVTCATLDFTGSLSFARLAIPATLLTAPQS